MDVADAVQLASAIAIREDADSCRAQSQLLNGSYFILLSTAVIVCRFLHVSCLTFICYENVQQTIDINQEVALLPFM